MNGIELKTIKRCGAPWKTLFMSQVSKKIRPCCYYKGDATEINPDTKLNIGDIWNNEIMQRIRFINSDRNTQNEAGGCQNCKFFQSIDQYYDLHAFNTSSDLSDDKRINQNQAIDDYENSRLETQATPLSLQILFGSHCNINCIMCWQANVRSTEAKQSFTADWLLQAKDDLTRLNRIEVSGGECLLIPEAVKFIKAIVADGDFEDTELYLYTNATLLHKHLEHLKQKRKVSLSVSLDSLGSTYEYIRQGARWKQVEANLMKFKEIGQEDDRAWSMCTQNILMKSSLDRIEDFARWSVRVGVPPHFTDFNLVQGQEDVFAEENIFAHPGLLDQVLNWETKLETAIEILNEAQYDLGARNLLQMQKNLKEKFAEYKATNSRRKWHLGRLFNK